MQERLNGSPTAIHSLLGESTDSIPSPERSAEPIPRPNGPASRRPTLMNVSLDLKAIPRDDGPPSETQLRRQKFQFFESKCSEISEGLFLSGEVVARNEGLLKEHGITHIVNCVGMICQEYFKDQGMTYRTYFLHGETGTLKAPYEFLRPTVCTKLTFVSLRHAWRGHLGCPLRRSRVCGWCIERRG